MTVRKTLVAACAALAATGIAAQSASAVKYKLEDPTGVILGPGGGFIIGSESGRELNGGICNNNQAFMPGYYHGYISASNPPGNFDSQDNCPATDPFPPDPNDPPDPPVDPNNPPQPPSGGGVPAGYQKLDDPSGLVLGDGGGIVLGNTSDRGFEAGICQKNTAGPQGYAYGTLSFSGPGASSSEGCAGDRPLVKAREATNVTSTSATFNGAVNPNRLKTTYWFEGGTTDAYGIRLGADRSAGSGERDYPVSVNVNGLEPGTTYHYRVVAKNSFGTTYGPDVTVTTP